MSSTAQAESSAARQVQRVERAPLPAREVRDPLEGVVEGANPQERYRAFQQDVLGRIWPRGAGGEYPDDFHRPARFDQRFDAEADPQDWIKGYTQFSPDGRDPANLSADEFETMRANLGTEDYVRVRSVPPQLLQPGTRAMHVGGSCVIETWGERTMKEERAGIKAGVLGEEVLPDTARQLVDLAPTISHASGALLGGYDEGVHLIESDMWAERIWKDYGVPKEEAYQITEDAYRRIHEMVQRRSRLINPNSVLVEVNFDELGLPAAIQQWMEGMGVPYDPTFRVAEVIHTYVGPQQHDMVKGAIQRSLDADGHSGPVRQAMENLLQTTIHLRGKQVDHLRWGSMDLPKEVIMGMREPTEEELQKMAEDPAYARGIAIMQDVYQRHMNGEPTSVAAGFADLPTYGNGVQHETRLNFNGRADQPEDREKFLASVERQFTDPARLHRKNVDQHLAFLQTYTADTKTAKKGMSDEVGQLQAQLGPVRRTRQALEKAEGQMAQAEVTIAENETVIDFYRRMQTGQLVEVSEAQRGYARKLRETAQKALEGVAKRMQGPEDKRTRYDEADSVRLPQVVEVLTQVENGLPAAANEAVAGYLDEAAQRLVKANAESRSSRLQQVQTAQQAFAEAASQLPDYEAKEARMAQLKSEMAGMASPSYFPLSENPFVHHAMQFLWDPDFAVFMREAVRIQEGRASGEIKKDDSNEQMRQLMGKVYPKLEAYVNYLFGRSEYPSEMRSAQLLSN